MALLHSTQPHHANLRISYAFALRHRATRGVLRRGLRLPHSGLCPDPNRRRAGQFKHAVLRGELRLLLHRCWFLLRGGESALQDHEVAATSGAFEGPAAPAQGLK